MSSSLPLVQPTKVNTMKKPRTFKQLQQDPRVSDWSDERSCDDGLWIYLAPGWVTIFEGLNTIHEDTVADCCLDVHLAKYDPDAWVQSHHLRDDQKHWLGLLPGC